MKNSKKGVLNGFMLLIVILAIASCVAGLQGQKKFDEATGIFECKKPDTLTYIMNPAVIAEDGNAEKLERFLTGSLGIDADKAKEAVRVRTIYGQSLAQSSGNETFKQYLIESGMTEEDAAALIKSKNESAIRRAQYQAELVKPQLNMDDNQYAALVDDIGMLKFVKSTFQGHLFMNSILYIFMAIILFVIVLVYVTLLALSTTGKTKKKARAVSTKSARSQAVTDFLLNYALYIILGAILVTVSIMEPKFIKLDNVLNILKQASTKGILALGCAGLIVLAGTDLSIGRVLGLSAAITASLVQSIEYSSRMFPQMGAPLMIAIPLLSSIAIAVVFSLINGFGVAKLHLHAFIITLGTQLIAQGATSLYIEAQPSGTAQALSTFDRGFLDFAAGNWNVTPTFKIPWVIIYFLALAVVMWIIWNKTSLGKNMFAVGGNEEAAAVSGVNVAKTIMLVYLLAGVLYGISAFLEAARITSVGANTGLGYELDAISACVVGGVSFSGGVGTIQGVVIGAVILQAINYSLQFLGVNPYVQYIIRGLIIIVAVSIDVRKYLVKK